MPSANVPAKKVIRKEEKQGEGCSFSPGKKGSRLRRKKIDRGGGREGPTKKGSANPVAGQPEPTTASSKEKGGLLTARAGKIV